MADLVVYGSYGYTGSLIAEAAVERGLDPTLAGRDRESLRAQAERLSVEFATAPLDDPEALADLLGDADVLLNCAGPFAATAEPAVDACLRAGTNYLDVTGEIDVFEDVLGRGREARDAGVVLLPGVGCDVVPTDCLAAHLAERLPDATRLDLAIHSDGGLSPGTARTVVDRIGEGGAVRRSGRIAPVPLAHAVREVDFDWSAGERTVAAIPWGDVSTAYHTTGIPNVTTYLAMPGAAARVARLADRLAPRIGDGRTGRVLDAAVDRFVEGPDEPERADTAFHARGEVRRIDGGRAVSRLRCPNTYTTTVDAALAVTERVLDGRVDPGAWTPAGAFGPDLILEATDAQRQDVV
jgi:short subunit dehydrogenase-like uncharacterized protein